MSLKSSILTKLRSVYPNYIHGGELERFGMELNHKASNAGRRCRELETEGLVQKIYNSKHEVMYRAIPIDEVPVPQKIPQKELPSSDFSKALWEPIVQRINAMQSKKEIKVELKENKLF